MRLRALALVMGASCTAAGPADDTDTDDAADTDAAQDTDVDLLTETFTADVVKLDLLLVVDDSASMIEEQVRLSGLAPDLLAVLRDAGLDAHVGVVTTDTDSELRGGRLVAVDGVNFVTPEQPQAASILAEMIEGLGTEGSTEERGLFAIYRAIGQPAQELEVANQGFVRPDASLHAVVLSDEEDQSAPAFTRSEFVSWAGSLKAASELTVGLSAIVGPTPTGCRSEETNSVAGSIYIAAARATGGSVTSICDTDWLPFFTGLVGNLAGATGSVQLAQEARPASVEITVVRGSDTWRGLRAGAGGTCDAADCFRFTVAQGGLVSFVDWRAPAGALITVRYAPR